MPDIILHTARCKVRPFARGDIEGFMAYRNDLGWMRYQGYKGLTREQYERDLLADRALEGGVQLAIEQIATGRLIGDVYLRREGDAYWIGYTVHPAFARQGYATEAVLGIERWAAAQGCKELRAGVLSGNAASVALLEKLGFEHAGEDEGELVYVKVLGASAKV